MRADLFNTVTFGHLKIIFIIVCRTKKNTQEKKSGKISFNLIHPSSYVQKFNSPTQLEINLENGIFIFINFY